MDVRGYESLTSEIENIMGEIKEETRETEREREREKGRRNSGKSQHV